MNFRQLEIFHAVMSQGSVSAAAQMLNVSQPTVSTILKHSEDRLGFALFERIRGRLVPTPEATLLFPEAERLCIEMKYLSKFAEDIRRGQSASVSIVSNPTLSTTLTSQAVSRSLARNPEMKFRLLTDSSVRSAVERVMRQEINFGLVYGPVNVAFPDAEVVGYSSVACAMRRDHPLAEKRMIHCEELVNETIITFGVGSPIRTKVEEHFDKQGIEISPCIKAEVSFSTAACILANQCNGIALIDSLVERTEPLSEMVLRPLLPTTKLELILVCLRSRPISKEAKVFEQDLRLILAEANTDQIAV